MTIRPVLTFVLVAILSGCSTTDIRPELTRALSDMETELTPDKTVALFQWEVIQANDTLVMIGETTVPEILENINRLIQEHDWDKKVRNNIILLPKKETLEFPGAITLHSVVNLRREPRHSSELVSQALMGTPMKVLKVNGYWLMVQTPDRYISWVDKGSVILKDPDAMKEYFSGPFVLVTVPFARLLDLEDQEVMTDLVLGNTLKLLDEETNHFKVLLPSGSVSAISKTEVTVIHDWADMEATSVSLVSYARQFAGMPYLWGGTSIKATDCSGFTKNIYFLNGLNLPRDAHQQMQIGSVVDSLKDFSELQVGDLVFFGRRQTDSKAEYASHVGLWLGDDAYIHASGNVHISSVQRENKYFDPYNLDRYLKAKRILGTPDHEKLRVSNIYRAFITEILSGR